MGVARGQNLLESLTNLSKKAQFPDVLRNLRYKIFNENLWFKRMRPFTLIVQSISFIWFSLNWNSKKKKVLQLIRSSGLFLKTSVLALKWFLQVWLWSVVHDCKKISTWKFLNICIWNICYEIVLWIYWLPSP